MSSDRTRIIGIFAAVAVVAGGAGYYFFKIYRPKQVLHDAQDEVTAWETRWKAARDCLLGPHPGSSKTAEALAIREMSPDPWNKGSCTQLMGKLTRDAQQQSGIESVEAAWSELESAATHAAQAFAIHVAESTTRIDDPLPAALDALDDKRAKLRAVIELPPAEQTGQPLAAAQVIAITDGNEPLDELRVDAPPSAHGAIVFGKTASRIVQVTLTAGAAPKVARKGPGAIRAVPDGSWGASPGETGVRVGAMDDEGAMPQPTEIKVSGLVLAVGGTAQDGIVLAGGDKDLVVAHYANGTVTTDAPIAVTSVTATTDVDGSIAAFWIAPDRTSHARVWRAGKAEDVVLAADATPPMCFAKDGFYTDHRDGLTFAEDAPQPGRVEARFGPAPGVGMELIGCAPDGAVARGGGHPQRFGVCAAGSCRRASLPEGAPSRSTTTMVGGKLVGLTTHGGVIAVWREDSPVRYFALPSPAHPVATAEYPAMAETDGKVIDIVSRTPKGFAIVRIPAI